MRINNIKRIASAALSACMLMSMSAYAYSDPNYGPWIMSQQSGTTTETSVPASEPASDSASAEVSSAPGSEAEVQTADSTAVQTDTAQVTGAPGSDQTGTTSSDQVDLTGAPGESLQIDVSDLILSVPDGSSKDSIYSAPIGLKALTEAGIAAWHAAGGDGHVQADPVMGRVPAVHVQMLQTDGNLTAGFTTNMEAFSCPTDGFTGLKLRLEDGTGDVFYRVYTNEHGWSKWAMNEMITPYSGDQAKVRAVQMRINGYTRNLYNFYYRAILNDGTSLGWAHDGQTAGALGKDQYIQALEVRLWKTGCSFNDNTSGYLLADNSEGVIVGADGSVSYSRFDGSAYTGWGYDTENNKYYFKDNVPVTGWQYIGDYKYYFDETGKVVTDLEPVMGLTGDYKIRINKDMKTLTVYTKDGSNGYIIPYKVILVTIGSDTPIGTFKTYADYRWKFMHDDIYCQYLLRIKDGFLLHSIIFYGAPDSYHLTASTFNQLGKNQSDGCIRMLSGDAAWVFNNCGLNTSVEIYNDKWVMGPLDRPAISWVIPDTQCYDPTDPEVIQAQLAAKG